MSYERIELRRNCPAVQIPDGARVTIPAGTSAFLTQSLGGSYTLQVPDLGGLFRVAGQDGDALGFEPTAGASQATGEQGPVTEQQVWDELRNVYDPEIPVNIVDLGLVYDMRVVRQDGGPSRVEVQMTLTAPGCGMGHAISMDAKERIERLSGVGEADVRLVWDPPWNPQMISPEGRAKLGMD